MNVIYRYKLTFGYHTYDVHPIYKDDMSLEYQLETGQMFHRASLSGKMDFVGKDADLIINAVFGMTFLLKIEESNDGGLTWSTFHDAKFFKTDCTINLDDKKVTVKPNPNDRYQKILDGMEKEFNLIELLPAIEPVEMVKRGVLQVYTQGDKKITNIFSGISWESDFDVEVDSQSYDTHYNFARSYDYVEMTLENPPSAYPGLQEKFTGLRYSDNTFRLENVSHDWYILRYYYYEVGQPRWLITDIIAYYNGNEQTVWRNIGGTGFSITFTSLVAGIPSITSIGMDFAIYSRWLCDSDTVVVEGQTFHPQRLASDDPMYDNRNYRYVFGRTIRNLVQSQRLSTTPTEYGRFDQTYYFNTPDDLHNYLPIGHSQWVSFSMWYYQDEDDVTIEHDLRKPFMLKDAYPLWSVLSVLLAKLETGVTFSNTSVYSAFFYGSTNPLDVANTTQPLITPKSNVIVGEYSEPAMKAPVTLATVLNMLKKAFGCYWFIDDNNRLRIEHISWFKNGGSYGGTHQVGVDLTKINVLSNGKPWSFGKNSFQFDKQEMAARYQYEWMDDCTDVFDGRPIDIFSPFVLTDKVEEISISEFSADVDYMMIAPENCSKDGFVLLMPKKEAGVWKLPIVTRTIEHSELQDVQNWFGSLTYLIPMFLTSDLPSWRYSIDETAYTSNGIQRGKKQQVKIPAGDTIPDTSKLVRTALGDGQIEKMTLNMASRMATATLKYDTYDNE